MPTINRLNSRLVKWSQRSPKWLTDRLDEIRENCLCGLFRSRSALVNFILMKALDGEELPDMSSIPRFRDDMFDQHSPCNVEVKNTAEEKP